jgi:hypothetical protein
MKTLNLSLILAASVDWCSTARKTERNEVMLNGKKRTLLNTNPNRDESRREKNIC